MMAVFMAGILTLSASGSNQASHENGTAQLIILSSLLAGLLHRWRSHRIKTRQLHNPSQKSIKFKTLALRAGLLALLVYSALLGHFQQDLPIPIFTFEYLLILPILMLATPRYVRWAEQQIPSGEDGYYRFGQFLCGQRRWNWIDQRNWLLMWGVKIIFIPLMYSWLVLATNELLHITWSTNPGLIVTALFMLGLSIDLLVATGGYLLASRLLGNEVLSTDRHWLGWLSCLICYPPLVFILHEVKKQTDDIDWSQWLLPSEPLYWFWAAAITSTWLVYWISTLHFGLRFSNLSWRGLIDTGPYRYTKHPAYISKNIYWWLHTVPFVGVASQLDLLRNLLGLSFVSLVYYLRAKTEERHLMAFPEYRTYSQHIDQYGLLARLKRPWQRASV